MNFRDFLAHDIATQRSETWNEDSDGNVTIEQVQNVQDVIDVNRQRFNDHDEHTPYKGEFVKVGSVPLVIFEQLRKDGILDDQERMKQWLNDPDNRVFRTRPGKV
jgi:hypothetical protein